jgi:uncharacterized membrane protein YsdA (DUF1294 family)
MKIIDVLPDALTIVFILMSVITFIVYAMDKSAAKHGRWRTKERTLHFLALIGGWPGAFLAQRMLRHKSKKIAFKRIYWLTVFLNVGMIIGAIFWPKTDQMLVFLNTVLNSFK